MFDHISTEALARSYLIGKVWGVILSIPLCLFIFYWYPRYKDRKRRERREQHRRERQASARRRKQIEANGGKPTWW